MKLAVTRHIVFAGGGTAGHLFPGIAVAHELCRTDPTWRVTFVGTGKSWDRREVAMAEFGYMALPCRPLPRGPLQAWRFLADNLGGYFLARHTLRSEHVKLVVGLGGYASVPMVRAAIDAGLPVVLLDQNVVPGRATAWLSRSAALVCAAMPEIRLHLPARCRVRITGNPIRKSFSGGGEPRTLAASLDRQSTSQLRLVVLGGSGGARTINEQVPLAIYKARAALADWNIVHQTGPRDAGETAQRYRKLGIAARVTPFVSNMAQLLRGADLALSRAGGTTLAELAALGVPAILIPYPQAARNHQRRNAAAFADCGAAEMIDECHLTARLDDRLAASVVRLASDSTLRMKMSQAMRRRARPDAARDVAAAIRTLFTQQRASAA